MKPLTIIKAGSTFSAAQQRFGDFEEWIVRAMGPSDAGISVVKVMESEALPAVDTLSGVIITGSHAMVTDNDAWIQELAAWIPQVVACHIPLLGICFGHQLLAKAMGGQSGYHPLGRELGTVSIQLTPEGQRDKLLGALPATFKAHTTHAQTVITLPANALKLAENAFESHHAFRLGDSAWGVQFHPEFSADVMSAYVSEKADSLLQEGHHVTALAAAICHTDEANSLLKRFVAIVQEQAEPLKCDQSRSAV